LNRRFIAGSSKSSLFIKPEYSQRVNRLLADNGVNPQDRILVIASGARSSTKRWPAANFIALIKSLEKEQDIKIILAGDKDDIALNSQITRHSGGKVIDLTGKTEILELAALLKISKLLITNDSATMHLASYLDTPVLALFGPTDNDKYGPWSALSAIAKKDVYCRPCEKAQCRFGTLECLQVIKPEDVLVTARELLSKSAIVKFHKKNNFKRILIVRTDRIGDVVLSTPVIKALRDEFPQSYIAMMTAPGAKEIVEGNPYLDQVIIYDKDGKHKSWMRSIKFARNLKKKGFDLAVILHPSNRVHLVTFLAGIHKRIGYSRKMGFLLTDRFIHDKQRGEKHESEYNLGLLKALGINTKAEELHIPIKPEAEIWTDKFFKESGISDNDRLLAIHPGASCPSKIWPAERFVQVADKLAKAHGFKVLVVAGPKDLAKTEEAIRNMHIPAINLAGKTSIAQLASVLRRCKLFISNDSGPVHIASAVGTPVISIFGRKQAGLSPKRWGPLGTKDKFLHKDVGCIECLAHNCVRGFACLKAISVDDVVRAAEEILVDN
jgi:heptosyltransferase-2